MNSKNDKLLETDLEDRCCDIASAEGCANGKLEKLGRGWPDRIFFLPHSQTMVVEFKRSGETPTGQQSSRHRLLAALGHPVEVIDSEDQFRAAFYRHLDLARQY